MLAAITWNVNPDIFHLGPLTVRWYGLFFAIAFILGYKIVEHMFKAEDVRQDWLDSLFMYVIIATVVGARLGHVFFYGWDYYSEHPGEILKVWHGGLASHGGAIGILLAIWLYSKKVTKMSPLWILDKIVIPVALAGCFIRLGNLMNSEIYGVQTSLPWGVIFAREGESVAKHPTQIYEAACYLLSFGVLFWLYWKQDAWKRSGLLLGLFFIFIFAARFFIEFVKEDQEAFEATMSLNMGQLLSIPFVLAGLFLVFRALKRPPTFK